MDPKQNPHEESRPNLQFILQQITSPIQYLSRLQKYPRKDLTSSKLKIKQEDISKAQVKTGPYSLSLKELYVQIASLLARALHFEEIIIDISAKVHIRPNHTVFARYNISTFQQTDILQLLSNSRPLLTLSNENHNPSNFPHSRVILAQTSQLPKQESFFRIFCFKGNQQNLAFHFASILGEILKGYCQFILEGDRGDFDEFMRFVLSFKQETLREFLEGMECTTLFRNNCSLLRVTSYSLLSLAYRLEIKPKRTNWPKEVRKRKTINHFSEEYFYYQDKLNKEYSTFLAEKCIEIKTLFEDIGEAASNFCIQFIKPEITEDLTEQFSTLIDRRDKQAEEQSLQHSILTFKFEPFPSGNGCFIINVNLHFKFTQNRQLKCYNLLNYLSCSLSKKAEIILTDFFQLQETRIRSDPLSTLVSFEYNPSQHLFLFRNRRNCLKYQKIPTQVLYSVDQLCISYSFIQKLINQTESKRKRYLEDLFQSKVTQRQKANIPILDENEADILSKKLRHEVDVYGLLQEQYEAKIVKEKEYLA